MILPSKHLPPQRSLVFVGSKLLGLLHRPRTVSRLWEEYRRAPVTNSVVTFDWFVLALDLLYAVGAVAYVDGMLRRQDESHA